MLLNFGKILLNIARFIPAWAILLTCVLVTPISSRSAIGQEYTGSGITASEGSGASPLDGFRFSAGIVRSGDDDRGSDPLRDTLVFKEGYFSSAVCERYNFSSAPYWIRRDGDQVHFLAELTSPTDGKMVWQGTVRDGKLEGTMRWTRKRWYWTIDAEHTIRGELKDESKQPSTN